MPVLFCFSHTSIKSKKVLMQIETQDNYGIIEEDIIYKIKDNLNNINNSQNKTIIINKFIANTDGNFKYFEVHPLMNTILDNYNATHNSENHSVLITSKVILSKGQKNIGLMYTYEVNNIFKYNNFSQMTDIANVEVTDFDSGSPVSVEFNIFLSDFPLELNNNSINTYEKEYQIVKSNSNSVDSYGFNHFSTTNKRIVQRIERKERKKGKFIVAEKGKDNNDRKTVLRKDIKKFANKMAKSKDKNGYNIKFTKKVSKNSIEMIKIEIKGIKSFNKKNSSSDDQINVRNKLLSKHSKINTFIKNRKSSNNNPYYERIKHGDIVVYDHNGNSNKINNNFSNNNHLGDKYKIIKNTPPHYLDNSNGLFHAVIAITYIFCLFFFCFDCCGICIPTNHYEINESVIVKYNDNIENNCNSYVNHNFNKT